MRFRLILCMLLAMWFLIPQQLWALPMGTSALERRTRLAGDVDGLNGQADGLAPGQGIDIEKLMGNSREAGVFDAMVGGTGQPEVAWTHEGFQDFKIMSAFLVIGSAGWGGAAEAPVLQINGRDVDSFQTSEIENSYTLNFFDLTPYVAFLEQPDFKLSFKRPQFYRDGVLYNDFGFLDFSAVYAYGRSYPGAPGIDPGPASAPVPEPATALLLGTGLLGAFVVRRRSRSKDI